MRAQVSRWLLISCALISGIASATLAPARDAKAQDTPSIFLHGLATRGDAAWSSVGDSLAAAFRISAIRPTLGHALIPSGITIEGGYASLSSMVNELQGYLAPSTQYAVVAHSVGALVARERILATAQAGQPRQVNRLLTVAATNKGAPLAQTVLGGWDQLHQYRPLDQQFAIMNDMVPWWAGPAGLDAGPFYYGLWEPALRQMAGSRSGFHVDITVPVPIVMPITTDLNPQAELYFNLNSPANMAYENGIDRVSIVGTTSNAALFAKAWIPILDHRLSPVDARSTAHDVDQIRATLATAFLTAAIISSVFDFIKIMQEGPPPCLTEAIHLYKYNACNDRVKRTLQLFGTYYIFNGLNSMWAKWIGAHGDNTTDALLPDSTQFYPGLSLSRRITLSDAWHGLETRESGAVIGSILRDYWSIPARIQPLTNSISVSDFFYTANPAGGQVPYSFLWEWCALDCQGGGGDLAPSALGGVRPNVVSRGWNVFSTAKTVYVTQRQRTLRATVTDAAGAQGVATYSIP